MKRTQISRISEKQLARLRGDLKPPKLGPCGWCGRIGVREWDHLVLRSLLPGENRDHRDNRMESCRGCNSRRARGWKPKWSLLSSSQQRFVIQMKGTYYAQRYFTGAPQ